MHNMEENKEHIQHLDELIFKVFADDRNAFRKVASAAMKDGFESGYQAGYKSGLEAATKNGTQSNE